MWRSIRLPSTKTKLFVKSPKKIEQNSYSTSSSGSAGKTAFSLIALTGIGVTGAVIYGKYDPKFQKVLQDNIPYIDSVYKLFPDDESSASSSKPISVEKKDATPPSLLRKKLDQEKSSTQAQKVTETKPKEVIAKSKDSKILESNNKISKLTSTDQNISSLEQQESVIPSTEKLVSDMIENLLKSSEETRISHENAVNAIKLHTKSLYDALDLSESGDGDFVWKEVNKNKVNRNAALKLAEDKALRTGELLENLKHYTKNLDSKSLDVVKKADDSINKVQKQLQKSKDDISSVETVAKTAAEYHNLVKRSKEQFQKELQIVLPNYVHGDKGRTVTESDLNLLIAHAHRRIEQLQKQLAKQQVNEKLKIDEAVRSQKIKDSRFTESKIEGELEKRHVDLESAVAERVASLKENFENELRKQLHRQAAAHADHIQEVLKVQEQELERKFSLDLEEKLLHQKGVFISETSGNMSRLKGILAFLKARSEFDKASHKAQALWLACQAMSDKISADNKGIPCPLGKDVAAVKIATDEDNEFITSILAGIPPEAVNRGVYDNEALKERFKDVKKICRKVALIDENNDSLFRYILSYLQSYLIIDTVSIPKEELNGEVAVDPSEWDTFDVLSRVSYCLKMNNLEQALRYANQLKGEPRAAAKDWVNEMKLLLETQLAVKALLAHAAAIGVQAYH